MPILHVKVGAKKMPQSTQRISAILLELTGRILGKKAELTSIAVDYVDPEDWFVGGKSLAEQGKTSVYFDVKVTDETNTKEEKALYISEAFAAFEKMFGNLHHESYIYVQDVRAAAYGYGGLTQEYRYQHP